jgi:hypothetical protein
MLIRKRWGWIRCRRAHVRAGTRRQLHRPKRTRHRQQREETQVDHVADAVGVAAQARDQRRDHV